MAFTNLRIAGLPTTLLRNADGKEVGRLVGPATWNDPELEVFLKGFAQLPTSIDALCLRRWRRQCPRPTLTRFRNSKTSSTRKSSFQALDNPTPDFPLSDAKAGLVHPADFLCKVVVLHFIYSKCTDVCPLHAEKLAQVQGMINQTPMKDMVRFISITTDPNHDTAEVPNAYGPQHGLDPVNWQFLTLAPGVPEDSPRKLAQAF